MVVVVVPCNTPLLLSTSAAACDGGSGARLTSLSTRTFGGRGRGGYWCVLAVVNYRGRCSWRGFFFTVFASCGGASSSLEALSDKRASFPRQNKKKYHSQDGEM